MGRRRPVIAALSAAVVVLSTVLGVGMVGWQWRRAPSPRLSRKRRGRGAWPRTRVAAPRRLCRQVERLSAGIALDQGGTLCETSDVPRGLLWLCQFTSSRLTSPATATWSKWSVATWPIGRRISCAACGGARTQGLGMGRHFQPGWSHRVDRR